MQGVERRRLDRVLSNDIDRVTTIVRYAPNSHFSAHSHGGGEEFIVLEGTFQDEYGDWPAGSYVRNPPGSRHTPGSDSGCIIFVKLQQFDPADRTFVHINLNKVGAVQNAQKPSVHVTPLFQDQRENVQLERWDASAEFTIDYARYVELFVLEGSAQYAGENREPLDLKTHSWLRLPAKSKGSIAVGGNGASVWLKEFTLPLQN